MLLARSKHHHPSDKTAVLFQAARWISPRQLPQMSESLEINCCAWTLKCCVTQWCQWSSSTYRYNCSNIDTMSWIMISNSLIVTFSDQKDDRQSFASAKCKHENFKSVLKKCGPSGGVWFLKNCQTSLWGGVFGWKFAQLSRILHQFRPVVRQEKNYKRAFFQRWNHLLHHDNARLIVY